MNTDVVVGMWTGRTPGLWRYGKIQLGSANIAFQTNENDEGNKTKPVWSID